MNENINLCEILKGLEGIELYSSIFGKVFVVHIWEKFLEIKNNDCYQQYTKEGKWINIEDAECTLFPSKTQRDWSKFERPIPLDTPMMCLKGLEDSNPWMLQKYSRKRNGKHYVKHYNIYIKAWIESSFEYMIPFDKFNPNNIEESLKYNIQK